MIPREFVFRKAYPPHYWDSPPDSESARVRAQGMKIPAIAPARGTWRMKVFPNGEFGIGYIPKERKKAEDKRFDKGIVHGYQVIDTPAEHELPTGEKYYDAGDKKAIPIKLGSASELSQPKKRYGGKGITAYGKKMVRSGAFLLHKEEKRAIGRTLQFSTVTIPALPPEQERCICDNWGELVRRFFEECSRQYRRYGKQFKYVCVSEIQPRRWRERGEVGLHLHYVYNAEFIKGEGTYCIKDNFVRQLWRRLLMNLLHKHAYTPGGSDSPFPTPNYLRQKVQKSAESYIGKYMSKGGKIVDEVREVKGAEYLPKQWWSMDTHTRKDVARRTVITRDRSAISFLLDKIGEKSKEILYVHEAVITFSFTYLQADGCIAHMLVGYGGRMSLSLRKELEVLLSF